MLRKGSETNRSFCLIPDTDLGQVNNPDPLRNHRLTQDQDATHLVSNHHREIGWTK